MRSGVSLSCPPPLTLFKSRILPIMSLLTRTLLPAALFSFCAALALSLAAPAHAGVEINWEALDLLRGTTTDAPLVLRDPSASRHPEKLTLTPPRPAVPRVTLIQPSAPPLPLAAPSTPVDISEIAAPTAPVASAPTAAPAPIEAALQATTPMKPATPIAPIEPIAPVEAIIPVEPALAIEPVLAIGSETDTGPAETASIAPAVPGSDDIAPAKRIQLASLKTHNEPNNTRPVTERGVLAAPALAQILFEGESVALHSTAKEHLSTLASELSQQSDRIELQAFGGAAGDRSTPARRLSLSRALAVRAYLIALGVGSNRIDVHALGGVRDGGPADRVDIVTSNY